MAVKHIKQFIDNARWPGPRYEIDTNGCWIWQRGLMPKGYPNHCMHRQFYEFVHGPLSKKYDAHHKCEVKSCVNPDHIEPRLKKEHAQYHLKGKQKSAETKKKMKESWTNEARNSVSQRMKKLHAEGKAFVYGRKNKT